jgi:hypothetical protein
VDQYDSIGAAVGAAMAYNARLATPPADAVRPAGIDHDDCVEVRDRWSGGNARELGDQDS